MIWYRSWLVDAFARFGPEPDVVLLVSLAKLGDGQAADQDAQRVGDRADRHAQVAGRFAVDHHLDLGLAERERRVEVDDSALAS